MVKKRHEKLQECTLYEKLKNKNIQCSACAHRCLISPDQTGICGVRKNQNGKLFLLVYGLPISQAVDPIEKKPLYHFLPGTFAYSLGTIGCNFKCSFCQNYDISQVRKIFGESISPNEIVNEAVKNKCKSIAYTYNEPSIWIEFVRDIARLAKKKGLKNILVTNGYQTKECLNFIGDYIDAMNIDLKSFNQEFYNKMCKASLHPVLETIKLAYEKKIHLEITTLLIPDENDSSEEIEKIAKFISSIDKNIPWHISRFFPMYEMAKKEATQIQKLKQAEQIGKKYLNYVYLGNIGGESSTFCPNCKNKIIKRFDDFELSMKGNKCLICKKEIKGVWK